MAGCFARSAAASILRWRRRSMHRAIKDRLICVFVNNGLLRKNEAERVCSLFAERFGASFRYVDATRAVSRGVERRSKIRRSNANGSATSSSKSSKKKQRKLGAIEYSGPRNSLSGRHRIGVGARAIGDDQVASQRRRLADRHEVQAHRAAARAIQRRSADAWQRAWFA